MIVGAGFGGLSAAKRLARTPARVTLIDRRNHHLFQPLLYQVATAALSPADIASPVRSVLRPNNNPRLTVLLDELVGVDVVERRVLTKDAGGVGYDYLILATGSEYGYFGHDQWARHAPGLKSIEDAIDIRHRVLLAFERAETAAARPDGNARRLPLNFVIVGGGPTGVEMAGALAELARATFARDFSHIDPTSARIILLEAAPRLLTGFPEGLARYAERALRRLGVEVRTGVAVDAVEAGTVGLKGGETIPAAAIIWCAGVKATPVAEWLGVEATRGGAVPVGPDLSVAGHPEIFVIGDAASAKGPDGRPLPGLAPVAKQQGGYIADLIARRLSGKEAPGPFAYRDWGTMATIGRSSAVGSFGRLHVKGFLAWLLWGLVHISYLIGFRNRMVVAVNWVWAWATFGKGARLIAGSDEADDGPPAGQLSEKRRAKAGS